MSAAEMYETLGQLVGQRVRLTFGPGQVTGKLVASRYRELDIERTRELPFHIEPYLESILGIEAMGANGRYQVIA